MGLKVKQYVHRGAAYQDLYLRLSYDQVDPSKQHVVIRFHVYASKAARDADIHNTLDHFQTPWIQVSKADFVTYFAAPYAADAAKNQLKHYHFYGYVFARAELMGAAAPQSNKAHYSRFQFDLNDQENVEDVFEEGQLESLTGMGWLGHGVVASEEDEEETETEPEPQPGSE